MGGKCCAPKFRSGYQGVDMTGITVHKFQEKWKEKLPRGGEWKVTKNTYICSKHFAEGDFVTNTQDKKKNRAMKRNCSLLRRYLGKMHFLLFSPIVLGTYRQANVFHARQQLHHRLKDKL